MKEVSCFGYYKRGSFVICTGHHHTCDSVAETEIEYKIFIVELFEKARVSRFRISENNIKIHP
jgi:hypothetical protein